VNDAVGEGNIESMLLVEKGLKELALLKVFCHQFFLSRLDVFAYTITPYWLTPSSL
jgi:hypothetical protein